MCILLLNITISATQEQFGFLITAHLIDFANDKVATEANGTKRRFSLSLKLN